MVAPKGPGHMVRRLYTEGKGMPALIAVIRTSRQGARSRARLGQGHRLTRAGVLQTTFKEETETDLFGEQAVLCGGASALVQAGFETLVEAGYQPEMAYFECLHELKLICDLMYESGIAGMRFSISETAKYGDITRGPRVVNKADQGRDEEDPEGDPVRQVHPEWVKEYKGGLKNYNALLKKGEKHQIEKTGAYLRSMMPWMTKKNIKGVQARPGRGGGQDTRRQLGLK
jgi:ketol-acid reductoisomerase